MRFYVFAFFQLTGYLVFVFHAECSWLLAFLPIANS